MTAYHNNALHKPYVNNLYTNPPLVPPSSTHPECASFYNLPLSPLLHVGLHSLACFCGYISEVFNVHAMDETQLCHYMYSAL